MLILGDSKLKSTFKLIEDRSVQSIITSPPYYLQRDYGHIDQIGLENTIDEYIYNLIKVFENIALKVKEDGTLFVNLSDTYSGSGKGKGFVDRKRSKHNNTNIIYQKSKEQYEYKRKSLLAIPQRLLFASTDVGDIVLDPFAGTSTTGVVAQNNGRTFIGIELVERYFKLSKGNLKNTGYRIPLF